MKTVLIRQTINVTYEYCLLTCCAIEIHDNTRNSCKYWLCTFLLAQKGTPKKAPAIPAWPDGQGYTARLREGALINISSSVTSYSVILLLELNLYILFCDFNNIVRFFKKSSTHKAYFILICLRCFCSTNFSCRLTMAPIVLHLLK